MFIPVNLKFYKQTQKYNLGSLEVEICNCRNKCQIVEATFNIMEN